MPDVYSVDILSRAEKELNSLPDAARRRVAQALAGLSGNPRPMGCRKLIGTDSKYRIRIGDYRVLYEIIEARKEVAVYQIRHRSDVYR
jgi:mRNA interferase RelE/StbE